MKAILSSLIVLIFLIAPLESQASGGWPGPCEQHYPHSCCGPDFRVFMRDLQKSVKQNWRPPKTRRSKKAVVYFKAYDDGTISDLKLKEASGWKKYDQRALAAVRSCTIPQFPMDAPSDVEIWFTFESNAKEICKR